VRQNLELRAPESSRSRQGFIVAAASSAFFMARLTSAISRFSSSSAACSFVACAFISMSPFAPLRNGRARHSQYQSQSEQSLNSCGSDRSPHRIIGSANRTGNARPVRSYSRGCSPSHRPDAILRMHPVPMTCPAAGLPQDQRRSGTLAADARLRTRGNRIPAFGWS
jgi:hypothetical protein